MRGDEAHFRSTLGSRRAGLLLQGLETGADRAVRLSAREGFTQPLTLPAVAFDLASGLLEKGFGKATGIHRAEVSQQLLWVVDDTYALRVKKIDARYRPTNHDSAQQRELLSQQLTFDNLSDLVYVTAGVHYSERTGLPDDFVVVKHYPSYQHHVTEWVVDLRQLAGGQLAPTTPIISPAAPTAPPATVASRRKPASAPKTKQTS